MCLHGDRPSLPIWKPRHPHQPDSPTTDTSYSGARSPPGGVVRTRSSSRTSTTVVTAPARRTDPTSYRSHCRHPYPVHPEAMTRYARTTPNRG